MSKNPLSPPGSSPTQAGVSPLAPLDPHANRARGELGATFATVGERTYASHTREAGGLRLRFPKVHPGVVPGCEAVMINTAGGMVGGDTARLAFTLEANAAATITTQSAEKIYRANGAATSVEAKLSLGPGAQLEWLPQETILFDDIAFSRSLDVTMAGDASLLLVEALVFGRIAMGEAVRTGSVRDRWRVRREGVLVFAEALALDGAIAERLDRRALGNGARALATLLLVCPEAESRLPLVREVLGPMGALAGASAWNGLISVRLLSASPERVRAAIVLLLAALRGRAAPRVWQ